MDLTDEQSINAAADAYGERSLDVLINVAGTEYHLRTLTIADLGL